MGDSVGQSLQLGQAPQAGHSGGRGVGQVIQSGQVPQAEHFRGGGVVGGEQGSPGQLPQGHISRRSNKL